jgi:CheY-like chemotaxis protein
VDLHVALERSVKIAQHQLEHRARVVRCYGELPEVRGDEGQLGQVFLNLLVNAAQAIPEGAAERHEVRITTRVGPDGGAEVEISDTGRGMSPEELGRAFDPFFTTKVAGLGLGLAIAHGTVRALGGALTAESTVGRGSTFRVCLPPAPAALAPEVPPSPPAPEATERLRILVVDDDVNFGKSLGTMLRFDHEVVVHPHARRALEQLREDAAFDVVLCDVMMPEMTGRDFYEELEQVAPALRARVIFMTGGAFTPAMRAFLDRVPNGRVTKPFRQAELEQCIRTLRAARQG